MHLRPGLHVRPRLYVRAYVTEPIPGGAGQLFAPRRHHRIDLGHAPGQQQVCRQGRGHKDRAGREMRRTIPGLHVVLRRCSRVNQRKIL